MRALFLAAFCLCVSLAARAQDATPTSTAPPATPKPNGDVEAPVPMTPVPGDQNKLDEGLAAYDAKDYDKAYKIFSEMADDYDLAAMRNVALMRRDGLGTDKDPEGAEDMMKEAARRGLANAQSDLAEMLLDGAAGPPDPKAALPWLQLAAEAGHPVAEYRLGQLYEHGTVVPKDLAIAEVLYADAAHKGVKDALDRLDALKGWKEPPPGLQLPPEMKPAAQAQPGH